MEKNVVYGFIGGLYIGRFTNFFSNIIITGLALYFYKPDIYTYANLIKLRETSITLIQSLK
jgi:hypothetical protein